MKFCNKCGSKVEDEQKFCPKCGINLRDTDLKNVAILEVTGNGVKDKSKISSGTKISIISAIIIAILLLGCFVVGNDLSKPSKTVSKLEQAINSEDKNELAKLLYSKDNRLEINEDNSEYLLNYFKENPLFLEKVMKDLNDDCFKFESLGKDNEINPKNDIKTIRLAYVGKKFFVFPSYKISVKPAFIEVKTALKDVELSLNSVEIGKSDKDDYIMELGPFMPGRYDLLASYKGSYVDLENTYNIDFINSNNENNNEKIIVEALVNLKYVKVTSEYPDAEIFVNNKETGVKVKEAVNFGPLSAGTSLYAVATLEDKKLKSNEVLFNESTANINLSFKEAEREIRDTKDSVKDLVNNYVRGFVTAVNYGSFYDVEDYIYPGSSLYNEQKKYVSDTYSKGIKEDIKAVNVTFIELNSDNKSGIVTTEEIYEVFNQEKVTMMNFKYKYKFRYNEFKRAYQFESLENNK